MAKRILKTLINNIGFKILAVFFAFILWLVVYNIDDPVKTKTFTTNVTVENESSLKDMNKCYEILEGTNTVTFAVSGKRSILDKLEDVDFTAVADMTRMVVNEDGTKASVPIEITCRRNSSSSLRFNGKNKYLAIKLEDYMSRRFMITADTSGKVAEGYALGEVTVTNPNVLSVSGPASIVKKIDSVVATIDVDGMSANLSDNVLPVLYDADGKEVDATRLKLSNDTVTISAKILNVKEVPLQFSTTGKPYGDYRVVEINCNPETVMLKGATNALNPLMALEIPADVINVNNADKDITTTIDISEYLPEGVELVDPSDATVKVTVRIEAYESQRYSINTSDIDVIGLGDGYRINYSEPMIPVIINGLKKDLRTLSAADLKVSVDVTGLKEGHHKVTLKVDLDEEHYAYQSITIDVDIVKQDADNQPEENSPEGDESEENQ